MVSSFVIIILLAVIYGYATEDAQFTSTASAIQEIWTGSCRLACQHAQNSRFNSHGGLQASRFNTLSNHAGPSSNCICEACPCAIIENIFRTCTPLTRIYSDITEVVANFFRELQKMIMDACAYIGTVLECGALCRQDAQPAPRNRLNFVEDIEEKESREEAQVREIKSEASSAASRTPEPSTKDNPSIGEGPSKFKKKTDEPPNLKKSSATKIKLDPKSCSKCRLKGVVCIPSCPSEKKKT